MNTTGFIRVAALTLAIVSGALASAPAQAQNLPFSFGFQTPDGFGLSFGSNGVGVQLPGMQMQSPQQHRSCLGMRDVVRLVRDAGYRDVEPLEQHDRTVVLLAEYGRQDYVVEVDPCRQRIIGHAPVRQTYGGWSNADYQSW